MHKGEKKDWRFPALSFRRQDFFKIALFAAVYFLAHYLAFFFPDTQNILLAIWPPGGIALAALLLIPRRLWTITLATFFIVGIVADLSIGRPLFNSIGFMTANVLESLGCAWLIIRTCGDNVSFSRVKEVVALLFTALFVNAVTACIGALTVSFAGIETFWTAWRTWWVSDGLGILLVTPFLVSWLSPGFKSFKLQRGRVLEQLLFFSLWSAAGWMAFELHLGWLPFVPQPYLLFALLAWPAFRFGQRGVTAAIVILAVLVLSSDAVVAGPLLWGGITHLERLIMAQLFLGVIASTGFLLTASYFEAKSAERLAVEEKKRLTILGDNLPDGMVYQVVREHDGRKRFLYTSAGVKRLCGGSSDEVRRDPELFYGRIAAEDRQMMAQAEEESASNLAPLNIIVRLRRPDEQLCWINLSSSPRRMEDGRILWDGVEKDITELKQAEEALRDSRAVLRQILDMVPQAIFWKDSESVYLGCNAAFAKAVGLKDAEQIRGKNDFDLPWSRSEAEAYRRDDHEVLSSGRAKLHIIEPLQQADGSRIWIDTSKVPLTDQQGNVYGVLGIYDDITARKAAEEQLRKSEGRLRASQEVARLGSWDLDLVSGELEWSDEIYKLFDKAPSDFVPSFEAFASMVHADDRDSVQTSWNKALESDNHPYHIVARITNDSGREWVMEAFGAVRRNSEGKPTSIFGTAQDVTTQKRTEEVLRQKERMMRSLLDSVDEGFIVINRDYRIQNANQAYYRHVGLGPAEVLGQHCFHISHRVNRPCFESGEDCPSRQVFETGKAGTSVHHHTDPDGKLTYVEIKAFPFADESGQVTSAIEVINDITEKQLLETERIKSQKLEAIGTLAGGIAHDFNNLLQGIFGNISMAKMNLDKRQKCLDMLAQAEKALQMSVNLTTQLLTFSKGGKPVRKKIDLRSIIEDTVKFALSGSRVGYDIIFDDSLCEVDADAGQIAQVIQNLALNAEQAMPEGGTVRVTAKNVTAPGQEIPPILAPGRYVEIALQDTGTGIPEKYMARVFDPYFTTKEKGSGLGLATSYSIIKNHGGIIDVTSVSGEGSTFTFWIPALEPEKDKENATPKSRPATKKYRILLMDDDEIIRNLAAEMLKNLGHEAVFAVNGEEVIEIYRESLRSGVRFDFVILDLTIRGGMGGRETIKALRAIDPEIIAVVSSGYADNTAMSEFKALGFRECLAKPYSLKVLDETLNRLFQ